METTAAVGLGPPGTSGALEGLDIIATCAMDLSANLGGEVFWISAFGPVVTSDTEAEDEETSLSVGCEAPKDVFLT